MKKNLHVNLLRLLLLALTLGVFLQVGGHDFLVYDDNIVVTGNDRVLSGLSVENAAWAFGTTSFGNWMPLTWLSHMLDVSLFGTEPRGHHLHNLLLHLLNVLLLFSLLYSMTGAAWPSFAAAALFAIHPLRAEPVSWVAARRDLLSAFWGLVTLRLYSNYARTPKLTILAAAFTCFLLGMMSKPTLITLPFLFLALDYWPLGRLSMSNTPPGQDRPGGPLIEKLPFFAAAALFGFVNYTAQLKLGAIGASDLYPLGMRLGHGLVTTAAYVKKLFIPLGLAGFYPHPGVAPPLWKATVAAAFLVAATVLSVRARRYPFLAAGWFWYLIAILPVAGFVQVGWHAMADRFTYFPHIGLIVALVWGLSALAAGRKHVCTAAALSGLAAVFFLAPAAHRQAAFWKNDAALFTHAIAVTEKNFLAHNNLGTALLGRGMVDEAIVHFRESLRILPENPRASKNLGVALAGQGRFDEALDHLSEAVRVKPDYPAAHAALGSVLISLGKDDEGERHFREALRLDPENSRVRALLGRSLLRRGRLEEAVPVLREAVALEPGSAEAHYYLAAAYFRAERLEEAERHFRASADADPANPVAHYSLGATLHRLGRGEEAAASYREALHLRPDYDKARRALERVGKTPRGGGP